MRSLLTTTAFAALLIAVPAFAQSDTQPAVEQPPAATETVPDAVIPETPAATEDGVVPEGDAPPDTALTSSAEPAPAIATTDPQIFIDQQAEDAKLASNWIGQSLYNAADESVGDINDLLFREDGTVSAVIVGVGGFLGIGEKDVAVAFDAIEARTDENGAVTLTIQASKEQLEAAPEFVTLADLRAMAPQAAAPEAMAPAPDAMAPAPDAPAPAPAQ